MLIDKDLRLSISGCFWLFYASKYSPNKLEFNYINTCLFKDCIVHKIKEFNGLNSEDAINKYKDILLNKIS